MISLTVSFIPEVGRYYKALYLPTGEWISLPNGKITYYHSPQDTLLYAKGKHFYYTHFINFIQPVLIEHFHFERIDNFKVIHYEFMEIN